MTGYTFTDATGYSFAQLADQITASFEGYFFPMVMSPGAAADFWRTDQVDATRSLAMHDASGTFAGMAWVATRGTRGCCAAFGIVPAFRGRGAGKLMAAEMVRRARASGLEHLSIEVLTQNASAIAVYEGVGFRTRHRLVGMEIETANLPAGTPIAVETAPVEALLPRLASARAATWGNELPSLLARRLEAVVHRERGGTASGLLVQRHEERTILRAVALPEATTTGEFAGWLRGAAGGASIISIHNEQDGTPVVEHCRALGFRETFSQYEMALDL